MYTFEQLCEKYPNVDWYKINQSLEYCLIMFIGGLPSETTIPQNYFDEYHRYSDVVLTHEQSEFYRTGEIRMTDYLEY